MIQSIENLGDCYNFERRIIDAILPLLDTTDVLQLMADRLQDSDSDKVQQLGEIVERLSEYYQEENEIPLANSPSDNVRGNGGIVPRVMDVVREGIGDSREADSPGCL